MWPGESKQEPGEITGKAVAAYFGSVVPDIVSGVGIEQGSKGTKVFASEELSGHLEYKGSAIHSVFPRVLRRIYY